MIQVYDKKENCSGCTACAQVCPVGSIEMRSDEKGFLYPFICAEKCIDCGRCVKSCPIKKERKNDEYCQATCWAVRILDEKILKKSSSGGVAYGLSEYVLKKQGVVYGAVYTEEKEVIHERIDSIEKLYMIQGSKYVQSNLGKVFQKVKKDLEDSKKVLFIGTMCQVAGLKAFLRKEYSQLYTVDLICFGVPSPWLYKKYLEEEVKKYMPCNINMRDKITGWKNSSYSLERNGKILKINRLNDVSYHRLFSKGYGLRDSCYFCSFKGEKHLSDLTLGDCWGADTFFELSQEQVGDSGMSMLFVNNEKGKMLLNEADSIFWKKEISAQKAFETNPMMIKVAVHPSDEEQFWQDIKRKSIRSVAYQYVPKESLFLRIKKKVYPFKQWMVTVIRGK